MKIKYAVTFILTAVGLLIGMFTTGASAQVIPIPVGGGSGSSSPKIEDVAMAYANNKADYYRGNFDFSGYTNGLYKYIHGQFTLERVKGRWGITQYSVNGVEAPIDPAFPMWALPPYDAGEVVNFWLQLEGYDSANTQKRWGYFNKPSLAKGEDIVVTINLNNVSKFLGYTPKGPAVGKRLGLLDQNGNLVGEYNAQQGGFWFNFDPINPPTSLEVVTLPDKGHVEDLPMPGSGGGTQTDDGFGFSLKNRDELLETPELGDGSDGVKPSMTWFEQVKSDRIVERGGTNYYGNSITVHLESPNDYLQVYAYGLRLGSRIEVMARNANGAKVKVGEGTFTPDKYALFVYNTRGYTDYVVTIIGLPTDSINGTSVYVYDTGNWTWSDGKGKGVPADMVTGQ